MLQLTWYFQCIIIDALLIWGFCTNPYCTVLYCVMHILWLVLNIFAWLTFTIADWHYSGTEFMKLYWLGVSWQNFLFWIKLLNLKHRFHHQIWRAWNCALHIWSMSSVIEIRFMNTRCPRMTKKIYFEESDCVLNFWLIKSFDSGCWRWVNRGSPDISFAKN